MSVRRSQHWKLPGHSCTIAHAAHAMRRGTHHAPCQKDLPTAGGYSTGNRRGHSTATASMTPWSSSECGADQRRERNETVAFLFGATCNQLAASTGGCSCESGSAILSADPRSTRSSHAGAGFGAGLGAFFDRWVHVSPRVLRSNWVVMALMRSDRDLGGGLGTGAVTVGSAGSGVGGRAAAAAASLASAAAAASFAAANLAARSERVDVVVASWSESESESESVVLAHLLRTLTVHGDADGFPRHLARRPSGLAGSAGARVGASTVGGVGAAAADADGTFDERKPRRPCGVIVASTSTHSALSDTAFPPCSSSIVYRPLSASNESTRARIPLNSGLATSFCTITRAPAGSGHIVGLLLLGRNGKIPLNFRVPKEDDAGYTCLDYQRDYPACSASPLKR